MDEEIELQQEVTKLRTHINAAREELGREQRLNANQSDRLKAMLAEREQHLKQLEHANQARIDLERSAGERAQLARRVEFLEHVCEALAKCVLDT